MASSSLDAMQAAGEALNELGVDQTEPVDPFPLLAQLGLKLSFQPLDGLLGAILDLPIAGSQPGVLITNRRGPGVQRYTAAHELGHWFLHREQLASDPAADGVQEIYGRGGAFSPREREAQIFAAYFLMPLPLVGSVARSYDLRRNSDATPTQVYSLARDLRVSYEAAARQLTNLGFINGRVRDNLLQVQPVAIKQQLGLGRKPTYPGHDVWIVDEVGDRAIDAYVGDDVVVSLAENPTTGYRWMPRDTYESMRRASEASVAPAPFGRGAPVELDDAEQTNRAAIFSPGHPVRPVADRFFTRDSSPELVGQGGERVVTLVADHRGHWASDLVYASPFDGSPPVEELTLTVDVLSGPEQWAKDVRLASVSAAS
jgi:Zn-dependent peptidase ImmA (M78 family)